MIHYAPTLFNSALTRLDRLCDTPYSPLVDSSFRWSTCFAHVYIRILGYPSIIFRGGLVHRFVHLRCQSIRSEEMQSLQRHAVNPSLGARLRHSCRKRSLEGLHYSDLTPGETMNEALRRCSNSLARTAFSDRGKQIIPVP